MIAIMLSPIYILLNIYILARLLRFFEAIHERLKHPIIWGVSIDIYVFFMLTPVTGYFLLNSSRGHFLKSLSNYWLGTLAIGFMVLLFFDISRLVLNKLLWRNSHPNERRFKIFGTLAILIIVTISIYGNLHSKDVRVKTNKLNINKEFEIVAAEETENLRVILIADIHLGYNTNEEHLKKVVNEINKQKQDLVIIAGDIFDNEYKAIKKPNQIAKIISGIESRYGTYACWGNHDIAEALLAGFTMGLEKEYIEDNDYVEFLEKSNIKMLADESLLIDNKFYIIGRRDPDRSEKIGIKRKNIEALTENMDKKKPIILMDHQPSELYEAEKAGVDLSLSGHTHAGQVFPGNFIMKGLWENPYGIVKKGYMYSCVTSGVGVWGPAIRIGSDSEVMVLDVELKRTLREDGLRE